MPSSSWRSSTARSTRCGRPCSSGGVERQAEIDGGATLGLLPAHRGDSRRSPAGASPRPPPDLLDRRVEITGPAEPKMIINALNSGARAFMADFEDSLSPTWENVVGGQAALRDAVRGTLAFTSPEGKAYRLGERPAHAPRAAARLAPRRAPRAGRWPADLRVPVRLRAVRLPQRRASALAPRHRAVPLPPEAPVARRGAPLERRVRPGPGRARDPAGHGPGHGPDRDDPRRVRDGGDPVRAAGALVGAQRRPLGLPVLVHQDVPRRRRRRCCRTAPRSR